MVANDMTDARKPAAKATMADLEQAHRIVAGIDDPRPIEERIAAALAAARGASVIPPDREALAQELTAPAWELGGTVPYEIAERAAAFLRLPAAEEVEHSVDVLDTFIKVYGHTVADYWRDEFTKAAVLLRRLTPAGEQRKNALDMREPAPAPAGEAIETRLERWGLPTKTRVAERCDDGYWTPWHEAQGVVDRLWDRLNSFPAVPPQGGCAMSDATLVERLRGDDLEHWDLRYEAANRILVLEAERDTLKQQIAEAVLAEREACTKVAEAASHYSLDRDKVSEALIDRNVIRNQAANKIAAAIRTRGNP